MHTTFSAGHLRLAAALLATLLAGGAAPAAFAQLFAARSQELQDGSGEELDGASAADDRLGRTLAVGDFNGDGRADLAVGDREGSTLAGAGAVHVVFGGAAGLAAAGDQYWVDFDPATLLSDRELQDDFGAALAAGNFDGDLYDDLAIGVPNENLGATADAGVVLVLYGSAFGLALDSTTPPRRFQLGSGGIGGGPPSANEHFGSVLAAADFNGDGRDDLAVGISERSVGVHLRAGSVLVLYGGAAGLVATAHRFFDQDSSGADGTMLEAADNDDRFGAALAAGDFDGDGSADLAVGVPFEDVDGTGGLQNSGVVQVIYGSTSDGLQLAGNQLWHENNVDSGGACEQNDNFGSVLAAGDLNGDGSDDLAVGTPHEEFAGLADAGAVTVLLGLEGAGITTFASALYVEDDFNVVGAAGSGDHFGAALAIGDFVRQENLIDARDLAIGIPDDDVWNGATSVLGAGSVLVAPGGLVLSTGTTVRWAQGYRGSAGALVPLQRYGVTVAGGDFDGDLAGDLAIGAIGVSGPGGESGAGAVYTLYGALFADNFESHDTSAWSNTAP